MDKVIAIFALMRDVQNMKPSTTSACRVYKACKALGLDVMETRRVLAYLDYCKADTGEPWCPARVGRVWE